MCGIVAYFGGAGNNLTRVMTGMSAIIYRAPDSTGVAIFGDDIEPVRTRKAVGIISEDSHPGTVRGPVDNRRHAGHDAGEVVPGPSKIGNDTTHGRFSSG